MTIPQKRCSHCQEWKPATTEFFGRNRAQPDGFANYCKGCTKLTRKPETKARGVAAARRKYAENAEFRAWKNAKNKAYNRQHKERLGGLNRARYQADRTSILARNRDERIADRLAALRYYSGGEPRCACPGGCGQTRIGFLAIDHVKGGGGKHRRGEARGGIFRWLRKAAYPPGFRVLCHNCNMARGLYGTCPHERAAQR